MIIVAAASAYVSEDAKTNDPGTIIPCKFTMHAECFRRSAELTLTLRDDDDVDF